MAARLPLIPGEDSFTVLPPKLTTLKLYMPLTADLYERNEYGDLDDSSTLLEGGELRGYQDQIMAALVKNRMPERRSAALCAGTISRITSTQRCAPLCLQWIAEMESFGASRSAASPAN